MLPEISVMLCLEGRSGARQAAQKARQASDIAQLTTHAVQQSTANPEEVQAAQKVAREARQASGAENAAQAVRQSVERSTGTDVRDAFNKALQAARSAQAVAAMPPLQLRVTLERLGQLPRKPPTEGLPGKLLPARPLKEIPSVTRGPLGKTLLEAEFNEGASEVGSNTAVISVPAKGDISLFLSADTLLAAGVFAALKAFRRWFRSPSIPGVRGIKPLRT